MQHPRLRSFFWCHRATRLVLLAAGYLSNVWLSASVAPSGASASLGAVYQSRSLSTRYSMCDSRVNANGAYDDDDSAFDDANAAASFTEAAAFVRRNTSAPPLPPPFLLVSVTWAETDVRFFQFWCNATADALQLPFAVFVSTQSASNASALALAAAGSSAAGRIHFSPPFPRPVVGLAKRPDLVGAHAANVRAALAARVPWTHGVVAASNNLWLRRVNASAFATYVRSVAPQPSLVAYDAWGWFWAGAVTRDTGVWQWRERLGAAAREECASYRGACAPGAAHCAVDACSLIRLDEFEGFTATRAAWARVLLPAVDDYRAHPHALTYPAEEIVVATAAAVARGLACAKYASSFAAVGYIAWSQGAANVVPFATVAELRALGAAAPLLVKRVPRDADHPLTRFVANHSACYNATTMRQYACSDPAMAGAPAVKAYR